MDDAELIARAAGGDDAAFELVVRRHSPGLWQLARSIVGDDHVAEEVVQDTWIKAHRALGRFRGEAAVRTWVHRICYRTAIDRVRVRSHNVVPLDRARTRAEDADRELRLVLQAALEALPEDEREAFTLVHVLGFTREEAAAIVEAPASTVRSRVARARERLALALSDSAAASGDA